jgi:uncharacterized protein
MENVLVAGVNTRAVACSLRKMGVNVFSADYFGDLDLQICAHHYQSILKQEPYQSCGHFTERFKSSDITDLAADYIHECDNIIFLAGISPENFPSKKIIGNKQVKNVDNKYLFYKKLKHEFSIPKTYLISGIQEAKEISLNHPQKSFIVKPKEGSGGYGIRELRNIEDDVGLTNFILQEKLNGHNISTSVLSTGSESKTIITSQQIIGETNLGQKEPYGYCGNIAPILPENGLISQSKITEVSGVAEEIVNHFGLVGSNGVDFILQDDELFIIEVNPRIQGTMECAELILNINMVEAHIEACQGHLIQIPRPEGCAVKMIVHAKKSSRVGQLDFKDVYDLPAENVIVEEGEPVVTVITSGKDLNPTIYSAKKTVKKVYHHLKSCDDP